MSKPDDDDDHFAQYEVSTELADDADDFWLNRAFLHDDLPDLNRFGEVVSKPLILPAHRTIQ